MPDFLFQITSLFFFGFLLANCVRILKLWEDKSFSWKRFFIHLRDTKEGRGLLFGKESLLKIGLIFLYGITIFDSSLDTNYHLLVFSLYLYFFIKTVLEIYNKDLVFPNFSFNTFLIFALAVVFEFLLFFIPPLDRFLWLLILDKLLFLLIAFLLLFFSVFFDFNSDLIINDALKKLEKYRNLLVIAVVGSYGKGSTKGFISHILSAKYNILENKTSFGNEFGIAKTIISGVSPKKQIFIVEIDEDHERDISQICSMIIPKISVITGINDRKIGIFGSIEKIMNSKFQAIASLPKDGIALFNGNNENCLKLYRKTKNKKFLFSTDRPETNESYINAFNIKQGKLSLSFDIKVFGKRYKFSNIKLLGKQNVEYLLPAIFIGFYVGLDFSLIKKLLGEIKPLPRTMEPRITVNKTMLIDDTYNSNWDSIIRAIDYLSVFKGKKILVLEPLSELGKNASSDHYELGTAIGKVCNFLFLTNSNNMEQIASGVKKTRSSCKIERLSTAKIARFIERNLGREDVVLFEGSQARNSLMALSSESVF